MSSRPASTGTSPEAAGRRSNYHHGDLRRALIGAAIDLLTEGAPADLTLRGAALRAGVSQASPYRHFTDKAALLAAVAEEGFEALNAAVARATEAAGADALERFRHHGMAYVRFALEHPAHYRVMFGAEIPDKQAYPGLGEAAERGHRALEQSVRECQEAGYIREGEPEPMATIAWSMVHGLALLLIDRQIEAPGDLDRLTAGMATLLFEGLVRSPAQRAS